MTKEINYTMSGDCLIPDIRLEVTGKRALGKYGRMRRTFLEEQNPMLYSDLVLTEKLYPHLWEIQDTAERRLKQIMVELLRKDPAPDKKTRQWEWVQHMNSLKAQAEEVIMEELINS